MLSPLCVSHSRQAATQERHPMQRDGSRKIRLTAITHSFCNPELAERWRWVGGGYRQFALPRPKRRRVGLVLRSGPVWRLRGAAEGCRADFILWNLHHWLQNRVGQDICRLGMSVVVGHKDSIRAN